MVAMDAAKSRLRWQQEGVEMLSDSVEWWRGTPGRGGKIVVHPWEYCQEKFKPYPYPSPMHLSAAHWLWPRILTTARTPAELRPLKAVTRYAFEMYLTLQVVLMMLLVSILLS